MKDFQFLRGKIRKLKQVNRSLDKFRFFLARVLGSLTIGNSIFVFPFVLFLVFGELYFFNKQLEEWIAQREVSPILLDVKIEDYPYVQNYFEPAISANTAAIREVDSQVLVYKKNVDVRFSLASVTKLMTALVALEYFNANSVITINSPVVEGSNMGFYKGEKFYLKDLIYAMLLPSSNEAAFAIADNYPGGSKAFVARMNKRAEELRLFNTHYADPAGLDDDNNYSTASDMSRLGTIVMRNSTIAGIVSTKKVVIKDMDGQEYSFENLNKLLGVDGVNGIKTGTTEGAGQVLLTSKSSDGHSYVIVVMRSIDRFSDTLNLIKLIDNNIKFVDLKNY